MNEQISALIDGEIALEDAAHLIAAMQSNSSAAQAWSHYHLIGDVMRGTNTFDLNCKQSLMEKIELEPTVLSPNAALVNQSKTDAISPSAQAARVIMVSVKNKLPITWSIAASFTAVMVVAYMLLQTQLSNHGAPIQVVQTENLQTTPTLVMATEEATPAEYLSAHQASAPTASSYYIQTANYSE